jgi:hypothetical protein
LHLGEFPDKAGDNIAGLDVGYWEGLFAHVFEASERRRLD